MRNTVIIYGFVGSVILTALAKSSILMELLVLVGIGIFIPWAFLSAEKRKKAEMERKLKTNDDLMPLPLHSDE